MNTLIAFILIVAVLANFLLYKKAEYIWDEDAAKKVFWGTLIASFILGAAVSEDLGLANSGIWIWFIVNLGLTSLLSMGFSVYDGSGLHIWNINLPTSGKLIFDIVGFVASVLGIISFFLDR